MRGHFNHCQRGSTRWGHADPHWRFTHAVVMEMRGDIWHMGWARSREAAEARSSAVWSAYHGMDGAGPVTVIEAETREVDIFTSCMKCDRQIPPALAPLCFSCADDYQGPYGDRNITHAWGPDGRPAKPPRPDSGTFTTSFGDN